MPHPRIDLTIARAMQKRGLTLQAIADNFGVSRSAVRNAFDRDRGDVCLTAGPDCQFVEKHAPRPIRQVIAPPDVVKAATLAFAKGRITREMMRARITPKAGASA